MGVSKLSEPHGIVQQTYHAVTERYYRFKCNKFGYTLGEWLACMVSLKLN